MGKYLLVNVCPYIYWVNKCLLYEKGKWEKSGWIEYEIFKLKFSHNVDFSFREKWSLWFDSLSLMSFFIFECIVLIIHGDSPLNRFSFHSSVHPLQPPASSLGCRFADFILKTTDWFIFFVHLWDRSLYFQLSRQFPVRFKLSIALVLCVESFCLTTPLRELYQKFFFFLCNKNYADVQEKQRFVAFFFCAFANCTRTEKGLNLVWKASSQKKELYILNINGCIRFLVFWERQLTLFSAGNCFVRK